MPPVQNMNADRASNWCICASDSAAARVCPLQQVRRHEGVSRSSVKWQRVVTSHLQIKKEGNLIYIYSQIKSGMCSAMMALMGCS